MSQEKPNLSLSYCENFIWEKTPYKSVFICKVKEEKDPDNLGVPKCTVMALKMIKNSIIPPHSHAREKGWKEKIYFPRGGQIEIINTRGSKTITVKKGLLIVVHANEIFGLKNIQSEPLYFYSIMKPGFTGYQEIMEVKTK